MRTRRSLVPLNIAEPPSYISISEVMACGWSRTNIVSMSVLPPATANHVLESSDTCEGERDVTTGCLMVGKYAAQSKDGVM